MTTKFPPAPEFLLEVKNLLRRTEWGDFPDIIIHADELLVKRHPAYAAAKAGDTDAAEMLVLENETLQALRGKQGTELEEWWHDAFGYRFERLTESEARYLGRADDAYAIAERIAAKSRKGD